MRVIKYKVFEELIIDTTKTIENLKAGLVELEDLGFKVDVKWTRSTQLITILTLPVVLVLVIFGKYME
jgi:ABC-type glycerol-3-phosphate transport system permease component